MVNPSLSAAPLFWHALTRLGEAQILLPVLLLAAAWLTLARGEGGLAARWLGATAAAALLTTASKIAFMGDGLGWAALDFTGLSGHAMFAAAVLPVLLAWASGAVSLSHQGWRAAAGYGLAVAVALSRVMVHAHSISEALGGLVLGAAASAWVLCATPPAPLRLPRWLAPALLAWALLGVAVAPPSRTHGWVTRLALAISGRAVPYQRGQMHRDHQPQPQPMPLARSAQEPGIAG